MKLKTLVAALAIALTATACAGRTGPKQTVGTLGGAAVGGLIGSQIGSGKGRLIATGAGVFLGGSISCEARSGRRYGHWPRIARRSGGWPWRLSCRSRCRS